MSRDVNNLGGRQRGWAGRLRCCKCIRNRLQYSGDDGRPVVLYLLRRSIPRWYIPRKQSSVRLVPGLGRKRKRWWLTDRSLSTMRCLHGTSRGEGAESLPPRRHRALWWRLHRVLLLRLCPPLLLESERGAGDKWGAYDLNLRGDGAQVQFFSVFHDRKNPSHLLMAGTMRAGRTHPSRETRGSTETSRCPPGGITCWSREGRIRATEGMLLVLALKNNLPS